MSERSYIANESDSAMSFPELTTAANGGWKEEEDDESDFGEFSSASPKSDELATTAKDPSMVSASKEFGHAGRNLCGETRFREPNGYVPGQRISHPTDYNSSRTVDYQAANSHFEISISRTGDVPTTISGARGRDILTSHPELCVTSAKSESSESALDSSDSHPSAVVQKCESLSVGGDRMSPLCPDAEKSLDGLSVLSGSNLIGSVRSDSDQAKPGCDLSSSVGRQYSNSGSLGWFSSTGPSLPIDGLICSEDSSEYGDCSNEMVEFDDFQSVLQTDNIQERFESAGKQNQNWACFGDVGVCDDGDESWLAFQDNDLAARMRDEPMASQAVNSCLTVVSPSCLEDRGKPDNSFSRLGANRKKTIRESLESVYPTSTSTPYCDGTPSSISGTSHGSGTIEPSLLDLIGEGSIEGDPRRPSGAASRASSSAVVWSSLKVMEDTAALKFHWSGSRCNRLLLKSVAMESPTRLNTRRFERAPPARTVQEIRDHRGPTTGTAVTCRQPYESSFSQTVLSVTHLRM